MNFKVIILAAIILTPLMGNVALADVKVNCLPNAHGFPQIIQATDYATIEGIETLYDELKKFREDKISCEAGRESIIFKQGGTDSKVIVNIPLNGPVIIGHKSYSGQHEIKLFATLNSLLTDLSKKRECAGIKYDQFPTRAYKKRTIIEFDFSPQVVTLEAFSNGPKDEERLYILDLVDRKESFFFEKK
ncbi:MAG: hypothetical protein WA666_06420 [Nitrospirota bacterium]